jgi:hypothetical protein
MGGLPVTIAVALVFTIVFVLWNRRVERRRQAGRVLKGSNPKPLARG